MDNIKRRSREELEALLKLLAQWERDALALIMLERREAERLGKLY